MNTKEYKATTSNYKEPFNKYTDGLYFKDVKY